MMTRGLKRAERDQRDETNFNALDPVTPEPREGLSGSPNRVPKGWATLKLGPGRLRGWYCRSAEHWKILICVCVCVCVCV